MRSARLPHTSPSARAALVGAAAFAAGTTLPPLPLRQWVVVLAPLAVLGLLSGRRRPGLFLLPLTLGVGVVVGHRLADPLPALLSRWSAHGFQAGVTTVGIKGSLLDVETLPDGRLALSVRMDRFEIPGVPPLRGRPRRTIVLRLTAPLADDPGIPIPRAGDAIEVDARIGPARAFRNPGAFDYPSYLEARGVALVGSIKSARLLRAVPGGRGALGALPARARRVVVSTLERAAGGGRDATVSFLAALLVGERNDLPSDFEDRLIRAGVYHIVALSGFNVALMLALASVLLRVLPLGPRARRALLALCVLFYWGVARPSGSIARAALMAMIYLGGALLGRRVPGTGALASASVLILVAHPVWCRDAGFQLSFAATLGLLLLAPRGTDPDDRLADAPYRLPRVVARRARGWLLASLGVSAGACLSTSLVSARHFQTMTPVALVANLFAVPIAGLLLVLGLLVCALEPIAHPAAASLLALARFLVAALDRMTTALAAPAWCSFSVLPPPVWLVLAGQSAIVLAGLGGPRLRRAALLFLVIAITATAAGGRSPSSTGLLELIALDVGQGDALLVRLPGGTSMLVDAGGFARSRFDVGAKVVAPALRALGLLRIDILAITHAHRDHIGGARSILRAFSPGAVWLGRMPGDDAAVAALGQAAAERGIPLVFPRRGARIFAGGARVEVLNPGPGVEITGPARNDDSLVLRLSFGGRSVLLTGDLESPLETVLVLEDRDLRADLLKVGHHGSRTSTTGAFLRRVRPRLAVISVGATNPWGHPDAEVVNRLLAADVEVYRTDRDGAVRFTTDGVSPWRARSLTGDGAVPSTALRTLEGSFE